jgi:Flp pilus assembly protein TadD
MSRLKLFAASVLAAGAMGGLAYASGGGGEGMGSAPSVSGPAYDVSAEYARGMSALQAQQYREAAKAMRRVTDAVPSSVEAWRMLGEASAGEEDWKGARHAYERVVRLAPDDWRGHAGLGLALAKLKDAKAQDELAWLKSKSQGCSDGCADAQGLKTAVGEVEGALSGAAPKPAARVDSPMIFAGARAGDAAYSQAVALINERRYDDALARLAEARAVFGPHPDILTYEGYAWRKKGDFGRAESYYRQALAIAPKHRGATEYYGELKVERGDLGGARQMLARLDAACPYGCAEAEELRRWIDRRGDPELR